MIREGIFIGDRYEIIAKVGTGGMADVFKAKDHKLNRFVAIKILKQEFNENDEFVSKFRAEAQAVACLTHPNIVNVYDVGDEKSIHYIVMELVEGITLKTYIEKKGQLNVKEAVSIAIQAAMGIEAAHNNQIVHRDIKPQNIIISKEGKVKVTDFGIARATSSNTTSANIMGSVHYSSPEQARGGYIDAKSDIYSLGITLYEMITGRVPFDGETAVSIAIQHLQEEMTPPGEFVEGLPISVEKIILKCTQKNPDRRYATITELIKDLKHSLISPDEDFVKLIPLSPGDATKTITEKELQLINQYNGEAPDEPYDETYDESDEDDDDEDDEEEINPKLDKAISILGIVTAVIIFMIIIYLAGSFFGLFRFGSGNKNDGTEVSTDVGDGTMIDVVGMEFEEAKEALKKLGYGIKKASEEESDKYPEGYIVSQNIKKGEKAEAHTTLEVVVSTGASTLKVPDVVGLEEQAAINRLSDYGLKYSRDYKYSDDVDAGLVISMKPEADKDAKKDDVITIVISRGKESVDVVVPDVRNSSESAAREKLESLGLTVGNITKEHSSNYGENMVISQSKSAGSKVEKGTAIDLVISLGQQEKSYAYSATIELPGVDGGKIVSATAEVTLKKAGSSEVIFSNTVNLPYDLSVNGITGASSGQLTVKWTCQVEKTDGSTETQTGTSTNTVSFTQVN